MPLVALPGARWLPLISQFIPQFIPQCPVLGWAGDPGSLVLGPRTRTGREFHEGAKPPLCFSHKSINILIPSVPVPARLRAPSLPCRLPGCGALVRGIAGYGTSGGLEGFPEPMPFGIIQYTPSACFLPHPGRRSPGDPLSCPAGLRLSGIGVWPGYTP